MSIKNIFTSEPRDSKLEAVFKSSYEAKNAKKELAKFGVIHPEHVSLIEPQQDDWAHRIERDTDGIRTTLVKTHALFGFVGLLAGAAIGFGLIFSGTQPFASSPLMTSIVFASVPTMAGLLFAGLISLRPDHDLVIDSTRSELEKGHSVLMVHASSRDQLNEAKSLLEDRALRLRSTL